MPPHVSGRYGETKQQQEGEAGCPGQFRPECLDFAKTLNVFKDSVQTEALTEEILEKDV